MCDVATIAGDAGSVPPATNKSSSLAPTPEPVNPFFEKGAFDAQVQLDPLYC